MPPLDGSSRISPCTIAGGATDINSKKGSPAAAAAAAGHLCAHCGQPFAHAGNRRGECPHAPDRLRDCIEAVSCLSCAKCLHYHCIADGDHGAPVVHPCSCGNADGHFGIRWLSLTLLSVLVPCLCLYPPLIGCYGCGRASHICGGPHDCGDTDGKYTKPP